MVYIASHYPKDSVIVTVDADGQHKPGDAFAVCKKEHPEATIS